MGRGKPVTKSEMQRVLDAIRLGKTVRTAAAMIGRSEATIYTHLRSEVYLEEYAEARQAGVLSKADQVDDRMEELAYADTPAPAIVTAWAKRHHPGYRDKQQVELTGPDGGPAEIVVRHDPAELVAMLQEVGLVRSIDAEALDGAEPAAILPARSDAAADDRPDSRPLPA